jgi:hypothetical protein
MQLTSLEYLYHVYPVISGDGQKVFCLVGNKLYKIDSDGSNKQRIYDLSDVTRYSPSINSYIPTNENGGKLVLSLKGKDAHSYLDYDIYMLSTTAMEIATVIGVVSQPMMPPSTSIIVGSARATHGDDV